MQRILNYYPNYPTHHLYFGEVERPYSENCAITTSKLRSCQIDQILLQDNCALNKVSCLLGIMLMIK